MHTSALEHDLRSLPWCAIFNLQKQIFYYSNSCYFELISVSLAYRILEFFNLIRNRKDLLIKFFKLDYLLNATYLRGKLPGNRDTFNSTLLNIFNMVQLTADISTSAPSIYQIKFPPLRISVILTINFRSLK